MFMLRKKLINHKEVNRLYRCGTHNLGIYASRENYRRLTVISMVLFFHLGIRVEVTW